MSIEEISRDEAKSMYENGETIAIVFDNRDPNSRVYEFSIETEEEKSFDSAVTYFEFKKRLLYWLENDMYYEKGIGASFYRIVQE